MVSRSLDRLLRPCPLARRGYRSVAVLAVIALSTGCGPAPASTSGPSARSGDTIWRPLGSWSGRGNAQTESFTVETGALRLRWETRNESAPGAGRFRVSLHSAISGRPLQTVLEQARAGTGTTFAEDEPRVSYLVIESSNVDWTAALEEGWPAPARR